MECKIIKPIEFCTDEYADIPGYVELKFTPEIYDRIARIQILIKENNLRHASITINGKLLDESGLDYNSLEFDTETLIISKGSFSYYAQGKFDSRVQIESEMFTLKEINEGFAKIMNQKKCKLLPVLNKVMMLEELSQSDINTIGDFIKTLEEDESCKKP